MATYKVNLATVDSPRGDVAKRHLENLRLALNYFADEKEAMAKMLGDNNANTLSSYAPIVAAYGVGADDGTVEAAQTNAKRWYDENNATVASIPANHQLRALIAIAG